MSSGQGLAGDGDPFGVDHEGSEDDVGESPLEGTDGFGLVVAGGAAPGQEGSGVRVVVRLGDCEAVNRGVELPVTCATEAVTFAVTGPHRQRRGPVVAGVGMPGLAEDLRGAQGGAAA